MIRRRLVLLSVFYALFVASPTQAAEGVDCTIAADAMEVASGIRGLRIAKSVPCKMQNRAEVERYLRDIIDKKIPAERIRNEGEVYRLLGIVPLDYDYVNGIIELYTEQLGGYYDPERKYYAMASWMPDGMQMSIAVHELTHALQDQHFKLDQLIDHTNQLSDVLMARSALIEGDATAVMLDYARRLQGLTGIAKEKSISLFMMQNISGAMLSSSMQKAPPALQALLIFPYVSGLNFAHSLLRQGGYRTIDAAFKKLPQSSEEILHPEKYGKKNEFIDLPVPKAPPGFSEPAVFHDRFGEFVLSTLLGSWLPPLIASQAASGWGGDSIALFRKENSQARALVWQHAWDTEADAREFYAALRQAYSKRFSKEMPDGDQSMISDTPVGEVSIAIRDKQTELQIIVPTLPPPSPAVP